MNKISEIGPVTLESEVAILDARKAYESLPDKEKEKVTNLDVLVASEATLNELHNPAEPTPNPVVPEPIPTPEPSPNPVPEPVPTPEPAPDSVNEGGETPSTTEGL